MKVRAYRARGFAGLGYLRAARERRGEVVGHDHRLMLGRLIVIGQTGILEPIERTPRPRHFPAPPMPRDDHPFRGPSAVLVAADEVLIPDLAKLTPDPGRQRDYRLAHD